MNTHINEMGIIGLHTPRYDLLFKHLMGHFVQFKRWCYEGATFSLVPAAQLPQDVAGVSLGAGEQQVDPRDIFNPILHKGFTGESLGAFLDEYMDPTSLRGDSLDYSFVSENPDDGSQPSVETAYYQMLTQGGFRKMMPMDSIRNKSIYPLVYDLATTRQMSASWNNATTQGSNHVLQEPINEINELWQSPSDMFRLDPSMEVQSVNNARSQVMMGPDGYMPSGDSTNGFYSAPVPFITPRKKRLGWMDTLQKVLPVTDGTITTTSNSEPFTFAQLPKLMEYVIVTPPSYFTKLYYRLVIKHHVSFAVQRSAQGAGNALSSVFANYWNYMDQLPGGASVASVEAVGTDVTKVADGST